MQTITATNFADSIEALATRLRGERERTLARVGRAALCRPDARGSEFRIAAAIEFLAARFHEVVAPTDEGFEAARERIEAAEAYRIEALRLD